eukprot:gnl/TRDRNA2_/TRDRNA2_68894_c0_seq1.p1 gnl/TRDRNA2_/TRDRNA2_68894_c0~~gnl/TRDRNA2_/TRDRNA2_68894_c0_seq1.p1  ORF type:complete len:489 (+),score=54.97 gnl/TRDRNA2_/TRDRNA2_68894_c0_seq1:146-1468(+)
MEAHAVLSSPANSSQSQIIRKVNLEPGNSSYLHPPGTTDKTNSLVQANSDSIGAWVHRLRWHIFGCSALVSMSLICMASTGAFSSAVTRLLSYVPILGLAVVYMAVSVGLICFNKYLVSSHRFPFPVPLVAIHSGFSFISSLILLKTVPSMFLSISCPVNQFSLNLEFIVKRLLPISGLFAASLVCSNQAYFYCSVAFLQMVKESTVVFAYLFSVVVALEQFSKLRFVIVLSIALATCFTAHGDIHFSPLGFFLQVCGVLSDGSKNVLQAFMLQNTGQKLDPMTFVLMVNPVIFTVLAMLLAMQHLIGMGTFAVPHWSDIGAVWHLLLANACVAYSLNLLVACFLRLCSPVAVALVGITKDVLIVVGGVMLFSEDITMEQAIGFTVQLSLIFVYSMLKCFPEVADDVSKRMFSYGSIALTADPPALAEKSGWLGDAWRPK